MFKDNAKRNAQTVKRTRENLWLLFVYPRFRSESMPYPPEYALLIVLRSLSYRLAGPNMFCTHIL